MFDLPRPTFRVFSSRWQWLAWEEWQAHRRRRGDGLLLWANWELLSRQDPTHQPADPESGAPLRCWIERESRASRGISEDLPEVMALRALDFLREIEEHCRERGTREQLAVCLTVQAVLLGRVLAREEEMEQLVEETWRLGDGEDGWKVHAAVEQALQFLNGEGPAGNDLDFFRGDNGW